MEAVFEKFENIAQDDTGSVWVDLAKRIARRLRRWFPWIQWDDLFSVASLGAGRANDLYDPAKSGSGNRVGFILRKGFYLSIDIMRHSRMVFKVQDTPLARQVRLDDRTMPECRIGQEYARPVSCYDLLAGLSAQDKVILLLYYDHSFQVDEIAEYFNLSPSGISYWKRLALEKLKRLRKPCLR